MIKSALNARYILLSSEREKKTSDMRKTKIFFFINFIYKYCHTLEVRYYYYYLSKYMVSVIIFFRFSNNNFILIYNSLKFSEIEAYTTRASQPWSDVSVSILTPVNQSQIICSIVISFGLVWFARIGG